MEGHTTSCCILPPAVFCYALIRPSVLLLKIRNLQNGVGILQLDFAWEWGVAGFSPADLRNWTAEPKKTIIKTHIYLLGNVFLGPIIPSVTKLRLKVTFS